MAAQKIDLKNIIKRQYVRVNSPDNPDSPYQVLKKINNTRHLSDLLKHYTKNNLQEIIDILQVEIKSNQIKKLIIKKLTAEIIKTFKLFLEVVNDNMYQLLLKLRENKQVLLQDMKNNSTLINFLLQRGFVFRGLEQKEESLVLPEELLSILNQLDDIKMKKIVKRNTEICKMGTGILYYYGVMETNDFFITLNKMFNNFSRNRIHTKIKISEFSYSDYRKIKAEDSCVGVFRNYVNYSTRVNEFNFCEDNFTGYFSYYQVFLKSILRSILTMILFLVLKNWKKSLIQRKTRSGFIN